MQPHWTITGAIVGAVFIALTVMVAFSSGEAQANCVNENDCVSGSEGFEKLNLGSLESSAAIQFYVVTPLTSYCSNDRIHLLGVLQRGAELNVGKAWLPTGCQLTSSPTPTHYFKFAVSEHSRLWIRHTSYQYTSLLEGRDPSAGVLVDRGSSLGFSHHLEPGVPYMIAIRRTWKSERDSFTFNVEINKPKITKPTVSERIRAQHRAALIYGDSDFSGGRNLSPNHNSAPVETTTFYDDGMSWMQTIGAVVWNIIGGMGCGDYCTYITDSPSDTNSIEYHIGHLVSGIVIVGDIRDIASCVVIEECGISDLALNFFGIVPFFGDAAKGVKSVSRISDMPNFAKLTRKEQIRVIDDKYNGVATRLEKVPGFDSELKKLASGNRDNVIGSERIFRLIGGEYNDHKVEKIGDKFFDILGKDRGDFDAIMVDSRGRKVFFESHSAGDLDLLTKAKTLVDGAKYEADGADFVVDLHLYGAGTPQFKDYVSDAWREFGKDLEIDGSQLRVFWWKD